MKKHLKMGSIEAHSPEKFLVSLANMLDNMCIEEMQEAVSLINKNTRVEASGGVTLETVEAIARTGVDYISVGSLTHSVRSVDMSLRVVGS